MLRAEVGQHTGIVSADMQGTKGFSLRPQLEDEKGMGRNNGVLSTHSQAQGGRSVLSQAFLQFIIYEL